jgi:hypothetical protein
MFGRLPSHERKLAERRCYHRQRHIKARRGSPSWAKHLAWSRFWRARIRRQMNALARAARKNGWDKDGRGWRYQLLAKAYVGKVCGQRGNPGELAVKAALRMSGKTESSYNDAPWLRVMENALPHNRLDWMIPGQPYCGFGCIWAWWVGARTLLPDGTVYTPNICPWGGKRIGKVRFTRVRPEEAKPGALVVCNFGFGGAKHVALARGRMVGGVIRTVEFNTSAGNSGSQANGGGCYPRVRSRSQILCTVNVEPVEG